MTDLRCTRCDKRLSRKTARLIDGKLLCSTCMFAGPNCRCPERLVDMACYGIHACKDGKRIAPEDLYVEPTSDSGSRPEGENAEGG
jgi:hypothetical protein